MLHSSKHRTFGIIVKILWCWSTFNKKPKVSSEVTTKCRVSKFVKHRGNIRKIIGFYSANYYSDFWISFIKNGFFLGFRSFEKVFSTEWYFSTLGFTLLWTRSSDFFKKREFNINLSCLSKIVVDGNWCTDLLI